MRSRSTWSCLVVLLTFTQIASADDLYQPPWSRHEQAFTLWDLTVQPFESVPNLDVNQYQGEEAQWVIGIFPVVGPLTFVPEFNGREAVLDVTDGFLLQINGNYRWTAHLHEWYLQFATYGDALTPTFEWFSPTPTEPFGGFQPMSATLMEDAVLPDGWHYWRYRLWIGSYGSFLERYGLKVRSVGQWQLDQLVIDVPEPSTLVLVLLAVGAWRFRAR